MVFAAQLGRLAAGWTCGDQANQCFSITRRGQSPTGCRHLKSLDAAMWWVSRRSLYKMSECNGACVEPWRREASGEAMSCCTFSSSLAIWSVPLRERCGGGGCKSCGRPPSPPFSFFVMVPGRTCGGGAGRGRRGAEGLICILLPFAAGSV